ncbi:dual specificity phosphatase [Diplocarpon rosae]|nr:dual specificity phosphatase [Diplocarpon rosae]
MTPLSSLPVANGRSLKRPFTTVTGPPSPKRATVSSSAGNKSRSSRQRIEGVSVNAADPRGRGHFHFSMMPSAAGPRMYENQIPPFMSVYDMDATVLENPDLAPIPKLSGSTHSPQLSLPRPQTEPDAMHTHQHSESTSTQASDSTDSSPTTTISTVDSSSLSDPSPSSSPESPITLVPLCSFPGSSFGLDSFQGLKMDDANPPRMPMHRERPMTSPSPRRGRNLKSLALNLSPSADAFQSSKPPSPSFIKPPALTGRRKPSLLSLNTGAANGLSLPVELPRSPGVSTMMQRRGLKHSISSPHILSTPSFGPSGGMTLGGEKKPLLGPSRFKESTLAMKTFTIDEDIHESPTGVQMATRIPGVAVGGDSFDRPHSGEDAKTPSYPDGPILMHEPSVYLYLEPKAEEAMKFDVVINVAREVKNPFKTAEADAAEKFQTPMILDSPRPSSNDSPPVTAFSVSTFQTAFEVQPSRSTDSSPTTPKPSLENKLPEYIHVLWDHNTDVKDELWNLCELIDTRSKEGKKVLVHCQQGASRSATLIIAYHMYKNQDLGPNEAYSQAQSKSPWVNPNMSLLFSLNDFKKVIEKKKAESNNVARKPTVKHRPTLSADGLQVPSTPPRARGNSTPSVSLRETSLPRPAEMTDSHVPSRSPVTKSGGFDFGFGDMSIENEASRNTETWEDLMSPRLEAMTENPIQGLTRGLAPETEAPSTPSLFSPRPLDFPVSSFFPPVRVSLAVTDDPRSPPTKGEAPITRSIDEFL